MDLQEKVLWSCTRMISSAGPAPPLPAPCPGLPHSSARSSSSCFSTILEAGQAGQGQGGPVEWWGAFGLMGCS